MLSVGLVESPIETAPVVLRVPAVSVPIVVIVPPLLKLIAPVCETSSLNVTIFTAPLKLVLSAVFTERVVALTVLPNVISVACSRLRVTEFTAPV